MKAYQIQSDGGIDALALVDLADPRPGPGQILIRVRAVSLNFRDLMIIRGGYGRGAKRPLIPMSDGAGEVVEIGEGVTRVKKGDRVAGIFFQDWIGGKLTRERMNTALGGAMDGMLAEHVVLDQEGVAHLPDHLTFEEGATLPCAGVTAWNALTNHSGTVPGETVLALGTGGVSIFTLQFARMHGARVIVTSSSDEKLERARALGASETINYRTHANWEARVLELTGGNGVDHVVEVGGAGTLPRSMRSTCIGGRISVIGLLSGVGGDINPLPILWSSLRVNGIYVGSREMFEAMNRAVSLHPMKPVIDRVFPFADARAAYRHLESGSHFGKVVIAL